MSAKVANEFLGDDIYHLDVSDTDPEIVVTADATAFLVRFYRYNGAFTADGTVASLSAQHEGIININ